MQDTAGKNYKHPVGDMARALGEHGKRVGRENEGEFRQGFRQLEYVLAVIANFVLLYVANNLLAWNVPYLTDSFVAPLGVINLSLLATVAANLVFLAYDPAWFRHLARLGLNVIAFGATYTLFIIFPFDFGAADLDSIVRIAFVAALVGIAIAAIVEFFQLIFGLDRR